MNHIVFRSLVHQKENKVKFTKFLIAICRDRILLGALYGDINWERSQQTLFNISVRQPSLDLSLGWKTNYLE